MSELFEELKQGLKEAIAYEQNCGQARATKFDKKGNRIMFEAQPCQKISCLIFKLRAAGWDEKSINDFILWIESGDEQYKPTEEKLKQLKPTREP